MPSPYSKTVGLDDLKQHSIMRKSKPDYELIKEKPTEHCLFKLLLHSGEDVPHYFVYLRNSKNHIGEIRITEAEQVFFVPAEYVQLSVEVMTDITYFITQYIQK